MQLLVFAHRAEARAFTAAGRWREIVPPFQRPPEEPLLICGEGLLPAATKLAAALGAMPAVQRVVNLGVAGILAEEVEQDRTYKIRTIYAEGEFASHSCDGQMDLISSHNRIEDRQQASALENFAPLVDREAWALARVCRLLGRRFSCHKVAADRPARGEDACKLLRQQAGEHSRILLEHFQKEALPKARQDSPASLPGQWHFTVSMKRKLESLWPALVCAGVDLPAALRLDELERDWPHPKDRSRALLKRMEQLLHPQSAAICRRLDSLLTVFDKGVVRAGYDPKLEDGALTLRAEIRHRRQLASLENSLSRFDWEAFRGIFGV